MECDDESHSIITDDILRKKVSQIVGFVFPKELDIQSLRSMVQNPDLATEIDYALSEAPKVKNQ